MAAYTSGLRLSEIAVRTVMSADTAVCRDTDTLDAVQADRSPGSRRSPSEEKRIQIDWRYPKNS